MTDSPNTTNVVEIPSAGGSVSNNKINEDMRSTDNFKSCQVTQADRILRSHMPAVSLGVRTLRSVRLWETMARKKKKADYSSTQRAVLLRSHLS